jgi:hypothetical protein
VTLAGPASGPAPASAHERHGNAAPALARAPVGATAIVPTVAAAASAAALTTETVVVVLADVAPASRLWGYARFLFGRYALPRVAGLRFSRVLGAGHEGGFGLRPSVSRQGLLCAFEDADSATRFVESPFVQRLRERSRESLVAVLRAYSCRGSWGGRPLALSVAPPAEGPVAALTRASIRPSRALQFWRNAPPAEESLARATGCALAVGLGEAPLLRQATFSVWESVAAMDAYARTGAHLAAIRASHAGGYFSESMFVRFVPVAIGGTWRARAYG